MFETVSLPSRIRATADNTLGNRASRRRAGRVIAATVVAGALLGASSAGAMPIGAAEHEGDAPVVDTQVLRNDRAEWAAWKIEQVAEATRKAIEAEAMRPHTVSPAIAILTSGFGERWGSLHAGIDLAGPIGTPIGAVMDGTVIEAGPASGFGLWVRVQHADGTISVYGHVNDILSTVGQHVRAGDVIATIGNRGQSTGPHLHLEIWLPGGQKIDPLGWLAEHGVMLGPVDAAH
ncbi:M23 family metallopeptidase [Antrihabitans sp. YC2-6]|uniref:M23 family metallopeptidase n=1 Tax=Antrihabitans sp. YC2-6 TaxID=2799498 RepID=UPI0018F5AFFE|nr:M23 family metallopeptidase [Antrihabitans sp. YC2-6]MBJ8348457.1 M23 family metallopeptidase [Antrihabitans sp. YC2-6]